MRHSRDSPRAARQKLPPIPGCSERGKNEALTLDSYEYSRRLLHLWDKVNDWHHTYDKGTDADVVYKNNEQQIFPLERIFVFLYSEQNYYDHRRHTETDRQGRDYYAGA